MKDTVITGHDKRRELLILIGCFAAAVIINVACIIYYGTRWTEVFTQVGYTVCITVGFYALVWLVRIVVWPFRRKK